MSLVLDVAPVGPLVHAYGDRVLSGFDVAGDVELRGESSALAVADPLAVDPQVERRVDAFEVHPDLSPVPVPSTWNVRR